MWQVVDIHIYRSSTLSGIPSSYPFLGTGIHSTVTDLRRRVVGVSTPWLGERRTGNPDNRKRREHSSKGGNDTDRGRPELADGQEVHRHGIPSGPRTGTRKGLPGGAHSRAAPGLASSNSIPMINATTETGLSRTFRPPRMRASPVSRSSYRWHLDRSTTSVRPSRAVGVISPTVPQVLVIHHKREAGCSSDGEALRPAWTTSIGHTPRLAVKLSGRPAELPGTRRIRR